MAILKKKTLKIDKAHNDELVSCLNHILCKAGEKKTFIYIPSKLWSQFCQPNSSDGISRKYFVYVFEISNERYQ